MQGDAVGVQGETGDAEGCSGAKLAAAKPAAAKPAAVKADYSRPRQTMADQAPVISAVLLASPMHLLAPQSGALRISAYGDFQSHPIPSQPNPSIHL